MKTLNTLQVFNLFMIINMFLLVSCEKNNPTETPQDTTPLVTEIGTPIGNSSTATIGAAGGTLHSDDGNLTIIIPDGALSSSTEISIVPVTNEAPLGLGSGYRLQPERTTFAKPVQLVFQYSEQILKSSTDDFLWIVTQAADRSWNAMLKSVTDKNSQNVTIETTHFSDWALGRFIDFALIPSSTALKKGQSVQLKVTGFVRDKAMPEDEELAPLVPITGDDDDLVPLTPIPPIESRLVDFKVKQWTLNGSAAPVSNSNGSLSGSGRDATYTAPSQKPAVNPVAVSVQLETSNKEGAKATFLLTSNISIVDSDLYLLVKIDGQTYEYLQYGFNGTIPPDPNNALMANCGYEDGILSLVGIQVVNATGLINNFGLVVAGPSESSRRLIGFNEEGDDYIVFNPAEGVAYSIDYTLRTPQLNGICDWDLKCSDITLTLLRFTGTSNSVITGSFSGILREEKPEYDLQCKTDDEHSVEGEFNLMIAN